MIMNRNEYFVEVGFHQVGKHRRQAFGDVFVSRKMEGEDRTVCVLADGLGSGVKANVLATLTATMAAKYIQADIDIHRASEIIMSTLPVCSKRKIGYSTFTIADIRPGGEVRLIEYENPAATMLRGGQPWRLDAEIRQIRTESLGMRPLRFRAFHVRYGDRIVIPSDGVTQAGIGRDATPLGWGEKAVADYVQDSITRQNDISARQLARTVVGRALAFDGHQAADDISCAVLYFRRPRRLLVMSGPPIEEKKDAELAEIFECFDGSRIICGGTTANIIGRQLNREIRIRLGDLNSPIPPVSEMDGAELVTEGTITLNRVAGILEEGADPERLPRDAATRAAQILLDSDEIEFVVGTKINQAHQDPSLPVDLDIRRNLIKRLHRTLNDKYLKKATLRFI